jgi:hypothetical protein
MAIRTRLGHHCTNSVSAFPPQSIVKRQINPYCIGQCIDDPWNAQMWRWTHFPEEDSQPTLSFEWFVDPKGASSEPRHLRQRQLPLSAAMHSRHPKRHQNTSMHISRQNSVPIFVTSLDDISPHFHPTRDSPSSGVNSSKPPPLQWWGHNAGILTPSKRRFYGEKERTGDAGWGCTL